MPEHLFSFNGQPEMIKSLERSTGFSPELFPGDHMHLPQTLPYGPRFTEMFKAPIESLSLSSEELQARKNYIRSHRLLPVVNEFISSCKKEGITPSVEALSYMQDTHPPIDYSLDDFLVSQGIDTGPCTDDGAEPDPMKLQEHDEFLYKLDQLKEKYGEELEKLNRVCGEFCSRMFNLLREQSTLRPVTEQETQFKIHGIQQKFDYVKNQLRQNVCNAIVSLEKQYNHAKKRRALPKKAAEGLSNWFFEHLNDPYPSEEEKSLLAAQGGLTITQVNNWFGNKRIRYKRKCLEEEAKRAGLEGRVMEPIPESPKSPTMPRRGPRIPEKEE